MSHELRTPLNAVIGFAEFLEYSRNNLDQGKRSEYHNHIISSGRHLLTVINDILDLSKVEAGKLNLAITQISMDELLEDIEHFLHHTALEKDIKIIAENNATEVHSDYRLLKQIGINLLSNAIKFSKPGSRVKISSVMQNGEFVLSVEDNGIGMNKETIELVQQPFMQADNSWARSSEGTGLGLAIVNKFAALMQGRVEIESVVGTGTKVSVFSPVRIESTPVADTA